MANISNSNNDTIINGTTSDDSIYNSGSDVTIYSGAGNNSIWSANASNVTISVGEGNNTVRIRSSSTNVSVDTGDGDNSIDFYDSSEIKITTGSGNDSIESGGGTNATIDMGDGNNYVGNGNSPYSGVNSASIKTGNGADTITNGTFSGFRGGGSSTTIDSGEGNDEINNIGGNVIINAGTGNDSIWNRSTTNSSLGSSVSIDGGADDDYIENGTYYYTGGNYVTMRGGDGNDTIVNYTNDGGASAVIDGGADNDSIYNEGGSPSINGGAGNNLINLNSGSDTTVKASEGDDTISVSSSITNFVVESFGYGDAIQLATSPSTLTSIDGGIIAGNVTITGITSIAQTSGETWTTSTNSITYQSGQTAGASLSGSTITYSTVSSGSDEFTITGLSSTVGVSVSGTQVILDSTALDGKSGTVSISGGSYVLALSGVDTPSSTSGGWNTVGSNGIAVYTDAGTTSGWTLADDSKSVTYSTGTADTLLALAGVATGSTLEDISTDGQVSLSADNFGSNGVTVTSNPNSYNFNLSGNFNGNSFTGTASDDSIYNSGSNVTINAGDGNNSIQNGNFNDATPVESVTIVSGSGSDSIYNTGRNTFIDSGDGADSITSWAGDTLNTSGTTINAGAGDDIISSGGPSTTIDGGDGNDSIDSWGENESVNGGAGDDSIQNRYTYADVTMLGGAGNDSIYNNGGDRALIDGGDGSDSINNGGWDNSLQQNLGGHSSTIYGGAGDDHITNAGGNNVLIFSGEGNDEIHNGGWDGNTSMNMGSHYVTIDASTGNNDIFNRGNYVSIKTGTGNNTINNYEGTDITIEGGTGADSVSNSGVRAFINLGSAADTVVNWAASSTINGGAGNDSIYNSGSDNSINGGAGNDSINLDGGSNTTVNVSDGNDTITVSSGVTDFVVESFGAGDVIQLATSPSTLTSIDGGIIADNVTIRGITSIAQSSGNSWTTSTNSITYHSGSSAGASLSGSTITYSTVSSSNDSFTITGLSSTVGVSVSGTTVILDSTALDGVTGTVSISGDSYVLALSGVDTPGSTSGGWNTVGSDGVAVYTGTGTTSGWTLADDSKSITYSTGTADTLLALAGVATGASLTDISSDTVYLTADNFGSNGVTITSNPNSYSFNLSGDFNGNSFTGTDNADTITNYGDNISIDAGAGNDLISNAAPSGSAISANNSTLNGGDGNDSILSYQSSNVSILGGTGDDFLFNDDGGTNVSMSGGDGNDQINNDAANVTIDGGAGADNVINQAAEVSINVGDGNDSIFNSDDNVSINGGAGDDFINLYRGSAAFVDISDGNDTITVGSSVTDFVVEGFGYGDVIQLATSPSTLTSIDGGIIADNVTITGITSIAQSSGETWTTSANSITYQSGQTAGASLSGSTITYSTVSSGGDNFTITGLSSTVGVSVSGTTVVLGSTALDGKSGTISISGGDYVLALSGVSTATTVAASWNTVGDDEIAIYYDEGTTLGWILADDSKSVTYSDGNRDSLLALAGVKSGASLTGVSSDGSVDLTADNFGSNGVVVTSNPNDYSFNLSGDFDGNSFTGTVGNDTINNNGNEISINGSAGDDSINLVSGTGAIVNVSDGNDTIGVGSSVTDFAIESFGEGDVIQLSETPASITTIDGGIVAGDVTITGVTSIAQDSRGWTTSANSITYQSGQTAGASLNGSTITYSTVSSSNDSFTITGLSSTVGVSVSGTQVILNSTALDGKSGTVSISGGDYTLALNGVDEATTIASGWDSVGDDEVATYHSGGATEGWLLSDDSKSVTYTEASDDNLLVLEGIRSGASLNDVSSDGTVNLTADNFGSDGVTVTSNPNDYSFNLSGDFEGNSFTGTEGADNINNSGTNILINGVGGNDSINISGENSTVNGGADDDLITLGSGVAVAISYNEGDGNDTVYGYSESADLQINSSDGWSSVTSGNDVVFNVNENSSVTLVDAAGIIEPEIINEELPGRVVFSNWGYGFTPRDDSPLYGSPSLTEVSSADSSSGVNLQSNENLMSLSPQTDYIVAPSN